MLSHILMTVACMQQSYHATASYCTHAHALTQDHPTMSCTHLG